MDLTSRPGPDGHAGQNGHATPAASVAPPSPRAPASQTPSLRAQAVRACLLALASVNGPPGSAVRITIESDGSSIVYAITPGEAAAIIGPPEQDGLSVLAQALLRQLSSEPRTAKAAARAAGYSMGSHVYAALRELEGRKLAEKTPKGYRLRE
jgi:hypothetical protein